MADPQQTSVEPVVNIFPPSGPDAPTSPRAQGVPVKGTLASEAAQRLRAMALDPEGDVSGASPVFYGPGFDGKSIYDRYRDAWSKESVEKFMMDLPGAGFVKGAVWVGLDSIGNLAETVAADATANASNFDALAQKGAAEGNKDAQQYYEGEAKGARDFAKSVTDAAGYINGLADTVGAPQSGLGRFTAEAGRYIPAAVYAWKKAPQFAAAGASSVVRKGMQALNYGVKAIASAAGDFVTGAVLDDPDQSMSSMLAKMDDDQMNEVFGSAAGAAKFARDVFEGLAMPEGVTPENEAEARVKMGAEQAVTNVFGEAAILAVKGMVKALRYLKSEPGMIDEVIRQGEAAKRKREEMEAYDPSLRTSPTPEIGLLHEIEDAGQAAMIARDISPATPQDWIERARMIKDGVQGLLRNITRAKDHAVKSRRLINQKLKLLAGEDVPAGALRNPRTVLPAPPGSGKPDMVIGQPTFDDWAQRVEDWLTPEEIERAANWYADHLRFFSHFLGREDAIKVMIGIAQASAQSSPTHAMEATLLVRRQVEEGVPLDRLQWGNATGEFLYSFLTGGEIRGFGQKISDYADAMLGNDTRTYYDGEPIMGRPLVVDRHTFNGLGGISMGYINALQEQGYLKGMRFNPEDKSWRGKNALDQDIVLYDDIAGPTGKEASIKDALYERRADHGRELVREMNNRGWRGRTDWDEREFQAIDWASIQKIKGNPMETAEDVLTNYTTRTSFEIYAGTGSPFEAKYMPRLNALPPDKASKVVRDVSDFAVNLVHDSLRLMHGLPLFGSGGWAGGIAPKSMVTPIMGESKQRMVEAINMLGYLTQQTEVWGTRIFNATPKGERPNAHAFSFVSDGFKSDATKLSFFQALSKAVPELQGFQPYQAPDGTAGIMVVIPHNRADGAPHWDTTAMGDKEYADSWAQVQAQANEIKDRISAFMDGLDADYHADWRAHPADVIIAVNDWKKDSGGEAHLSRIFGPDGSTVGGTLTRDKLVGTYGPEFEAYLDDALAAAEGPRGPTAGKPGKGKGGKGRQSKAKRDLDPGLPVDPEDLAEAKIIADQTFDTAERAMRTAGRIFRMSGLVYRVESMTPGIFTKYHLVRDISDVKGQDATGRDLRAALIAKEQGLTQADIMWLANMMVYDLHMDAPGGGGIYQSHLKYNQKPTSRGQRIVVGKDSSGVPMGLEGNMTGVEATLRHEVGHALHEHIKEARGLGHYPVPTGKAREEALQIAVRQRPWLWLPDRMQSVLDANPGMTPKKIYEYATSAPELGADLLSAFLGRQAAQMRAQYPLALKWVRQRVNENPELAKIIALMGLAPIFLSSQMGANDDNG